MPEPTWSAIIMYDWLKAAHIIFVIFWMAGLFLLPRYYIYHQEAEQGSAEAAKWVERERKLRNIIITPSMVLVWVLGLSLAYIGPWLSSDVPKGWLLVKFLLVLGLSGYHGYMVGYGRRLALGERPVSGKALRLMNEIPGVAVVIIVILVVVKPF